MIDSLHAALPKAVEPALDPGARGRRRSSCRATPRDSAWSRCTGPPTSTTRLPGRAARHPAPGQRAASAGLADASAHPRQHRSARALASGCAGARIGCLPPQGYLEMVGLLAKARLVLTDSGGVQEETTALGVPCLTMRLEHRATDHGRAGHQHARAARRAACVLAPVDEIIESGGKRGRIPELWDGHTAERIAQHLSAWLARRRVMPKLGEAARMNARRERTARRMNALSVDVEDYFQVSALAPFIDRSSWDERPCRVERNVERLLELFEQRGARATFFTLGWIAERYPRLVRDIVARGPRTGQPRLRPSAGHASRPRRLPQDVRRAKVVLEDIGGQPVRGYRAPSFSIGHGNLWAFDVPAGGRLPLQLQRLSGAARPLRHARRAALRLSRRVRACSRSRSRRRACSVATCRQAGAATSGSLPTRSAAGPSSASTPWSSGRRSSTFIPGRSIPDSRACPAPA